MVAFLVTVLAVLLLVGIIYLLLQEPQLLAAGSAIAIGVVFATLPLIVTMTPFFGALVFGAGAVAITYGVMSINAYRRTQELRRELAIRQVRASMRVTAEADEPPNGRSRPADPEDDLLRLESERLARVAKRAAVAQPAMADAATGGRAAAKARTVADFEAEYGRLERAGGGRRGGVGRSGAVPVERARSLSRLARRKP